MLRRLLVYWPILLLLCTTYAHAQFVRAGKVFHEPTSQEFRVILTESGIFCVKGPRTSFQRFNPSEIKSADAVHAFISFKGDMYDRLLVGNNAYKILGSFILKFGDNIRVAVNNNTAYATVVVENPSDKKIGPSILAIHGTDVVLNSHGDANVALFEAQRSSLLEPYEVSHGALLLEGDKVNGNLIGLGLEQARHPCLKKGTIFFDKGDLSKLLALKEEQRRQALSDAIKAKKGEDPLSTLLVLRVTDKEITAFNYQEGEAVIINELKPDSSGPRICVMKNISLE